MKTLLKRTFIITNVILGVGLCTGTLLEVTMGTWLHINYPIASDGLRLAMAGCIMLLFASLCAYVCFSAPDEVSQPEALDFILKDNGGRRW